MKYAYFLGQGGGGDAEVNIHYGTTAPTDKTKLWVANDIEPTKVDMTNSLGIQQGLVSDEEITTQNVAANCYVYNGILYYIVYEDQTSSANRPYLYSKNLSTGTITKIGALYHGLANNGDVVNSTGAFGIINGNLYIVMMILQWKQSTSKAYNYFYDIFCLNLSTNTLSRVYNHGEETDTYYYMSKFCSANNKIFYLTQTRFEIGCYDGVNITNLSVPETGLFPVGTSARFTAIESDGTDLYVIYESNEYNNYTNFTIYKYIVANSAYDSSYKVTVPGGMIGSTLYSNGCIYLLSTKYLSSTGKAALIEFNVSTKTSKVIDNENLNLGNYSNDIFSLSYLQGDYIYSITKNKKYKFTINVPNGTLAVVFNTGSDRWKAIISDSYDLSVNPVSVYYGNTSNIGEKQNTYIHNGSSWITI